MNRHQHQHRYRYLLSAVVCSVACSVTCTAHAQSRITLYGIVDAGLRVTTNMGGKNQIALTGGNESASRFGMSGAEDLGAGYKAVFALENGFTTTTGVLQAGLEFGRQAYVGVATPLGTLTLGRQYLTLSSFLGPFASGSDWAARGSSYGYHPGGLDNVDGTGRANHALKFLSTAYQGLQFGATYGVGGVAGDASKNELMSFGVNYAGGPLKLAAAYLFVKNPNFSLYGNNANSSATASNITNPVFRGYASAASQEVLGAGASYTAGLITVGGIYTRTSLGNLGGTALAGPALPPGVQGTTARFNTGELNLKYQATPWLFFGLAYAYTRASSYRGLSGAAYQEWSLGAQYLLSKRTDVYLTALRQTAAGFDSTGARAVAVLGFATPSSSNAQAGLTFGLRHQF